MTFRQFVVPAEADILETLGAEPEPVDGETAVRQLKFTTDTDELVVTYDVPGRFVHILWHPDGAPLLNMSRNGAVLMRLEWTDRKGFIHVDVDTDELSGAFTIQTHPTVAITDTLLFS